LVDFINWQRLPAAAKIDDDYRKEVGGEEFKDVECYATLDGVRVRLTMASRFGHVGVTRKLSQANGYEYRVYCSDLTDFSDKP